VTEVSGVGHKSGIFPVFRRLVAPCSDRVDSELSSGLPPDYEPRVAARRAGRRGVGALLMRYSEPTAAFHKSMSGQTFRSNGPFCRESLPYPIVVRREKARIFRGIDVTLQMFHPPTLVPVQL
jgi:hypothetical protein